jgi:hypothetical protein
MTSGKLSGQAEADQKMEEEISTNASTEAEPEQGGHPALMYVKPRKVFNSPEERSEFVRSYKSKQKTEVRLVLTRV